MTYILHREAESAAPPERVWALLADAGTWSSWARIGRSELEERAPGDDPNAVGALRRFTTGGVGSRERVVVYEPPRRLVYELISGLPIGGYRAEVTLAPTPSGGTRITWHSTYARRPPLVGAGLHAFLGWFLADTAVRLARAAER